MGVVITTYNVCNVKLKGGACLDGDRGHRFQTEPGRTFSDSVLRSCMQPLKVAPSAGNTRRDLNCSNPPRQMDEPNCEIEHKDKGTTSPQSTAEANSSSAPYTGHGNSGRDLLLSLSEKLRNLKIAVGSWISRDHASVRLQLAETIITTIATLIALLALASAIAVGIGQIVLMHWQAKISASQSAISNQQSNLMQKQLDLESKISARQIGIASDQNKLIERQVRLEEVESALKAEPQVAIIRQKQGNGLPDRLQIFNIGSSAATFLGFGVNEDQMVAFGVHGEGIELIPVEATLQKLNFPIEFSQLEQEIAAYLATRPEKPPYITANFYFKDERGRLWLTPLHLKLLGRLELERYEIAYDVRNQGPRQPIQQLPKQVRTVE